MNEQKAYHGEKIGEGNFGSYGHYTQVCTCFDSLYHLLKKLGAVGTAESLKS